MENKILYLIIIFGIISIIAWLIGFNFANRKMHRYPYIPPLQQDVYQGEQIRGSNHLTIFLILFILISIMLLLFFFDSTPMGTTPEKRENVSIGGLHSINNNRSLQISSISDKQYSKYTPIEIKKERRIYNSSTLYGIQQISLNSYERAELFAGSLPKYFNNCIIKKGHTYKVIIVGTGQFSFFKDKEEAKHFKAIHDMAGFVMEFEQQTTFPQLDKTLSL